MEAVTATLPRHLLQQIESSTTDDLDPTCAALLSHFSSNATCSQLLEQLTNSKKTRCAKDTETALVCKHEGNAAFGASSFHRAQECYTKALRYAPLSTDADAPMVATLLVNRAAASHGLGLLDAAERDCTRAIELQPNYSKRFGKAIVVEDSATVELEMVHDFRAWYRRGRVWAGLQVCGKAREDLNKSLALETSVQGRQQVSCELRKLEKASIVEHEESEQQSCVPSRIWEPGDSEKLKGVGPYWTPEKHWGLQTEDDLAAGSLVLEEQPYTAILLKPYRNTHCHFCFEQLPPDPVACTACAIPMYCNEVCRKATCEDTSHHLQGQKKELWRGEHTHECGGACWSAVLPPDAVLATRMLSQSEGNELLIKQLDDLCKHYDKRSGENKVELHVMAAVLTHCFCHSAVFNLAQTAEALTARLVRLLDQVRANAMAIVSVHSAIDDASSTGTDLRGQMLNNETNRSMLCPVEQVNVAQAVYATGSRLNHSCKPNVHASFKKRHLKVRNIVPLQAGSSLELCYGPQVGEMERHERQSWLMERYFFPCLCSACNGAVTLSDLLLFAFRCSKAGCDGVVPGSNKFLLPAPTGLPTAPIKGHSMKAGRCLSCGAEVNMKHATSTAHGIIKELHRVRSALQSPSRKNQEIQLQGALKALSHCRDIFHANCKEVAKAEDLVAEVYCSVNRAGDAIPHCRSAIQILEKIYSKDHIAVANERLKMSSVALAAGEMELAASDLAAADPVMRTHYGPDYRAMEPACDQLHKAIDST